MEPVPTSVYREKPKARVARGPADRILGGPESRTEYLDMARADEWHEFGTVRALRNRGSRSKPPRFAGSSD